ncbi:unnamed protein product [Caenorhabditis angaria]|uniref:G-protein coupled receptors family 1 profile domain-containing protein n=1 Tax=Caenorhabditis angaria TaxID=860376 RepID=A0A9P1IMB2_9PELO|nr:unnamed protein product [Caenorhabditis angaria]
MELLATIAPSTSPINENMFSIVETTQICIWCFTVPFYVFITIFMVDAQRKRASELTTPFFKLCISTAVIDLLILFTNYFGVMFPKRGYFTNIYIFLDDIYSHTYLYIAWSTGICQAMSVSVLATNRLSAMIFPNKYQKMWRRLWLPILIQFLPGCLMGVLTFFNETQLFLNSKGGIVPKFLNTKMTNVYFLIGAGFLFLNCVYLIFAYMYLFYILRKRNNLQISKKVSTNQKDLVKRRERKLFIMSSIIVGVQLTVLIFFAMKLFSWFNLTIDEFYLFYNALSDLFASINPYLLWIFSDSLRKYIYKRLGIFRGKISATTTNITVSKAS